MLSILLNKYPGLMATIKAALEEKARYCEKKYNEPVNSYHYRFFKPDDPGIGGTANQYYATMSNGAEEHLLAQASAITVPTANAYMSFGWYVDADLADSGYLRVLKHNVIKQEILAIKPYQSANPKYLYLDFDSVIFSQQQELVDYIIYNGFGADQICMAIPFMFRIASKAALNLEDKVYY